MALLSPGIETIERNFASSASAAAFGSAATVGKFQWGPAQQVTSIFSESNLLETFGEPNRRTQPSWFSAQRILTEGNDLKLVRAVNSESSANAHPAVGGLQITIDQAGTGYAVEDEVQVLDDTDNPVTDATGTVTKVGTNGEVEQVQVFPGVIGENTTVTGYSIEITSTGGSGATGTVEYVSESPVTILNDEGIEAGELQNTDLQTLHEETGLPGLMARYVGEFGDNIMFDLISFENWDSDPEQDLTVFPADGGTATVDFTDVFQGGPQSSGQYGVIVYVNGTVETSFVFSLTEGDRDEAGSSIYLDDMVEAGKTGPLIGTALYGWDGDRTGRYKLSGGKDTDVSAGDFVLAWDLLADPETTSFQYGAAGAAASEIPEDAATIMNRIAEIAQGRGDCRIRLSAPRDLMVGVGQTTAIENMLEWRRGVDSQGEQVAANINVDNTYVSLEDNFKYQYDKYNDQYFWMSLSADACAADLANAREGNVWESAAGVQRGQLTGIVKLAYSPANQAQRDRLYKNSINPITSEPGGGTYINGDKTMTNRSTAFNRINVRDLFNLLKRSIKPLAKERLFENNTEFTRRQFREASNAFMNQIQGQGGVIDFQVVCDQTNNTPQVIDNNRFVATFRVIPPRSINFITLNFGAYGTGTDLEEVG